MGGVFLLDVVDQAQLKTCLRAGPTAAALVPVRPVCYVTSPLLLPPLTQFPFFQGLPPYFLHLYHPSVLQQRSYLLSVDPKNLPTRSDERRGVAKLDFGRYYPFLRHMDVQGHRQQGKQRCATELDK